ncbi:MAG: alpha/beta hydrolase [Clostridia bacterium]|nr:alpha/beta hydrolase [Clostridia bacterium]
MEKSFFIAKDGKKICFRIWESPNAKGLVQISHGMAESPSRYNEFAEFLVSNGYTVFADDHRAHGDTDNCSGYADGDVYSLTLSDMTELNILMREKYPDKKLVFFGHSYGSFLAQGFLEEHGELADGMIIGGSAYMAGFEVVGGKMIAGLNCLFGKSKKPAKLLAKMSFGKYNSKYNDGSTFISSIRSECERYDNDAECGFILSNNFYRSMFAAFGRLYKKENYSKIDTDKKLLLISGAADPVGSYSKTTKKLFDFYKNVVGVKDVELKLYEGVRHEYLNDVSRETARADILAFCNEICR